MGSDGFDVLPIREPGSTALGERLRSVVLDDSLPDFAPLVDAMIFSVSRAQLHHEKIFPALNQGKIVVSDRTADSTEVYQGYAGKDSLEELRHLRRMSTGGIFPNVTYILDVDLETSAKRLPGTLDRLESRNLEYRAKVREGFLKLAKDYPTRCVLVDGSRHPEEIHEQIYKIARERIERVINTKSSQ